MLLGDLDPCLLRLAASNFFVVCLPRILLVAALCLLLLSSPLDLGCRLALRFLAFPRCFLTPVCRFLRLATQAGKVGVWDWDIQSNRVTWTDSLYTLHGITPAEFEQIGAERARAKYLAPRLVG